MHFRNYILFRSNNLRNLDSGNCGLKYDELQELPKIWIGWIFRKGHPILRKLNQMIIDQQVKSNQLMTILTQASCFQSFIRYANEKYAGRYKKEASEMCSTESNRRFLVKPLTFVQVRIHGLLAIHV